MVPAQQNLTSSSPVIALHDVTVFAMVAAVTGRIHPNVWTRCHPKQDRSDADAAQVSVSLHSGSSGQKQPHTIQLHGLKVTVKAGDDGPGQGSLVRMEERDAGTGAEMMMRTQSSLHYRPVTLCVAA